MTADTICPRDAEFAAFCREQCSPGAHTSKWYQAIWNHAWSASDRARAAPDGWVSVEERLPEGKLGIPYMEYSTNTVLVIHRDRPDYPLTAHAILGDDCAAMGVRISTNGASKYKWICWYSVGRNLCNPFDMASGPYGAFKDSVGYERFLPNYFGRGITHWMPLPAPPTNTEDEKP